MKKKWISMLLAGAMIMSLSACGNGGNSDKAEDDTSEEKVTLNVLFNDTDENVEAEMEYVMDHISEVLPNVDVKLEMVSEMQRRMRQKFEQ